MKVFFSKKGFWLSIILWIPFPLTVFGALYEKEYSAVIGISVIYLLIAWFWFGTKYMIKETHIVIMCGPFKYPNVPIQEIKKITHSRSALSAPACSLDRILISYAKYDDILISPKDEETFIKELLEKNPNIVYTSK